jgi:hypothetical protein
MTPSTAAPGQPALATFTREPDGVGRRLDGADHDAFWAAVNDIDFDALATGRLHAVFSRPHAPDMAARAIAFAQDLLDEA